MGARCSPNYDCISTSLNAAAFADSSAPTGTAFSWNGGGGGGADSQNGGHFAAGAEHRVGPASPAQGERLH